MKHMVHLNLTAALPSLKVARDTAPYASDLQYALTTAIEEIECVMDDLKDFTDEGMYR